MYVGKGNSNKQLFLEAVPKKFNRKGYMEVAAKMGLNPKKAEKYLADFKKTGWISHEEHNKYMKN